MEFRALIGRLNAGEDSADLYLEGSTLLLMLRETHRSLFVEQRLAHPGKPSLLEAQNGRDGLEEQKDLQTFLRERISQISDFELTPAAKQLLQLDQEDQDASLDHSDSVARLKAERESRIALVRELDRLIEEKKVLEMQLTTLSSFYNALPVKVESLAARVATMQSSFRLPHSRKLVSLSLDSFPKSLQTLYLHFTAYVDARLPAGSVLVQALEGKRIEIDFQTEKKGYCLHFAEKNGRVVYSVVRGPSTNATTNQLSLAQLLGDDWPQVLAHSNDLTLFERFFAEIHRRFAVQELLIPQIELLSQLQVHPLTIGGHRLVSQSRLSLFVEQASLGPNRLFLAKFDFPNLNYSLNATISIAPSYPTVKTHFELALIPRGAALISSTMPAWCAAKTDPNHTFGVAASAQAHDSVLAMLQNAVNASKGPRDANFDLSTRTAKCLLAFDLYAFSVLGMESARATWNVSRAVVVGRDRRIECAEI